VKGTAASMDRVLALWLHDHPGGTEEDFDRAGRPFNAEPGARHRRVHNQFLEWLNTERVQRHVFGGRAHGDRP
jgi:hypothetical protein